MPLQREPRLSGYSCFVDRDLRLIQDQWQFLAQLESLSQQDLNQILLLISPSLMLLQEQEQTEKVPPWELTAKLKPIVLESPTQKVTITLANHIYFDLNEIPKPIVARLRRLASFSNPVFFKTQALRFSTHGISRFISCARVENGYLAIPRGCLEEALALMSEAQIAVEINDKRVAGIGIKKLKLLFNLRKDQKAAINAMSKNDTGVLHAPTAFGKTITAIGLIARRKTNTLILVHSRQLVDQWRERLKTSVADSEVGMIVGGKSKPTGVIDIATYQSLINKKDNTVSELVQDYSHVIIDECHHVSAPRFEMVLNEVRAKYVLGLTATPDRQDGHQKIIFMAVGPIRHRVKNTIEGKFDQQVIVHYLDHQPPTDLMGSNERPKISDAYRWIMENSERTQQIVNDVFACIQQLKHPIVLTERRDHAEMINTLLLEMGVDSVLLKGAMRVEERQNAQDRLANAQAVVATGKYAGEGFDLPRLDTLFLAMPIAWKGSLAQYAGRIHRDSEGKESVTIHDYVDCALPMLQRMFNKRQKTYKAMSYDISFQ